MSREKYLFYNNNLGAKRAKHQKSGDNLKSSASPKLELLFIISWP